jgi:hypothetical protein
MIRFRVCRESKSVSLILAPVGGEPFRVTPELNHATDKISEVPKCTWLAPAYCGSAESARQRIHLGNEVLLPQLVHRA